MDRTLALTTTIGQLREAGGCGDDVQLAAVHGALGSSYALLFAERVDDGGVQAPLVDGVDPAYGERLTRAGEQHMLPAWLRSLQSGSIIDRATMQRDHDFARSAFFDYVVRPEGRFHCLITTPYVTPTQRFHMIVGRPIARDDFSAEDKRVLHALLPHVGGMIASGIALGQARADAAMLSSTLDRLSADIVLVTRDCCVKFANRGARRILALADGWSVEGGRLAPAEAPAAAALRQAVDHALSHRQALSPVTVRRPSGLPALELTVLPLSNAPEPLPHLDGDPPLAMVVVRQRAALGGEPGACVARAFGLTCKERELVGLLVQGQDLRGAALALGMCYNTARYHLRHIFTKTATHRQSHLIRLMLGHAQH